MADWLIPAACAFAPPTLSVNPMRLNLNPSRLLAVMVLFVAGSVATAQAKTHLRIATTADAMDAFNNWTTATSWQNIANFKNGNASRPVVDLVLQLQALRAGGLDFDFELVRALTYELAKQEVFAGNADLSAESIWSPEIDANSATVFKSEPVLAKGEFVKGLYGLPTNATLMKLSGAADFKDLTVAVVSTWDFDQKTIQTLGLKGVVKVATPELAYKAVQNGRADFMLDEFSANPDLHMIRGGVKLVPVPGFKVALVASRSYIVAKKAADADAILKALTAGLQTLKDNGTVTRAYTESGFFNASVANWKLLN